MKKIHIKDESSPKSLDVTLWGKKA